MPNRLSSIAATLVAGLLAALLPTVTALAQEEDRRRDAADVAPLESEPVPAKRVPPGAEPGASWSTSQPRAEREDQTADPDAPLEELVDQRGPTSRVFQSEDGFIILDAYTTPIHYPTPQGWQPVGNELVPSSSREGWVRSRGNLWSAEFGPAHEGFELGLGSSKVSVVPVAASGRPPRAAAPAVRASHGPPARPGSQGEVRGRDAVAEPGVLEYRDMWPGVDVRYEVRGAGIKEEIVLSGTSSPARFEFRISGAALSERPDGGVGIFGPIGERFVIPPPIVFTDNGADVSAASQAHYQLAPSPDGRADVSLLALVIDPAWLAAQPPDSFPVTLDPAFEDHAASETLTYNNAGGLAPGQVILGSSGDGGALARAGVHFGQYEPYMTGSYRAYSGELMFYRLGAEPWAPPETDIRLYDQGPQPTSFSEIGEGKPLIGALKDPPPPLYPLQLSVHNESTAGSSTMCQTSGSGSVVPRPVPACAGTTCDSGPGSSSPRPRPMCSAHGPC